MEDVVVLNFQLFKSKITRNPVLKMKNTYLQFVNCTIVIVIGANNPVQCCNGHKLY